MNRLKGMGTAGEAPLARLTVVSPEIRVRRPASVRSCPFTARGKSGDARMKTTSTPRDRDLQRKARRRRVGIAASALLATAGLGLAQTVSAGAATLNAWSSAGTSPAVTGADAVTLHNGDALLIGGSTTG